MYDAESVSRKTSDAVDQAIRWSIVALLVATASLKAYSPREAALLELAYEVPGWLVAVVVQVELLLAAALGFRLVPRATRVIAIALFTCFAAFSLVRALLGFDSCGCFGTMQVSPWWTFVIDLVVLAILGAWRPEPAPNRSAWRLLTASAAYGVLALSTLTPFLFGSPSDAESVLLESGGLTIVEPEKWLGLAFPLTPFLRPTMDLARGNWIVLLYHHDCPDCQAAKPKYEALADEQPAANDARRVLLVEVPPFGLNPGSKPQSASIAKLSDERDWFVQAPMEIGVSEGLVTYASLKLPSIQPESSAE